MRKGLRDDGLDRHARVERGQRILEDDLHLLAARRETPSLSEPEQILAGPDDAAFGGLDQPQHRTAEGRLAAAGFTDNAQRLAGLRDRS